MLIYEIFSAKAVTMNSKQADNSFIKNNNKHYMMLKHLKFEQ